MSVYNLLRSHIYTLRGVWNKRQRLLFPSPAEAEFMRIMGCKRIIIDAVRQPKTGFPLCITYKRGGFFKGERLHREVRVGSTYLDFGTVGLVYYKGIEIDNERLHRDIVKQVDRDEYLAECGWQVLHINAADVFYNRGLVQRKTLQFLAK